MRVLTLELHRYFAHKHAYFAKKNSCKSEIFFLTNFVKFGIVYNIFGEIAIFWVKKQHFWQSDKKSKQIYTHITHAVAQIFVSEAKSYPFFG